MKVSCAWVGSLAAVRIKVSGGWGSWGYNCGWFKSRTIGRFMIVECNREYKDGAEVSVTVPADKAELSFASSMELRVEYKVGG